MSDPVGEVVRQHRHDAVLELVIDHPPANALGHPVRQGLAEAIAAAGADPSVGAVVIRAAGRSFPAGAEVAEAGKSPQPPTLADLCARIEGCPKPVVAAIHGAALGGGLELALAAHHRIAAAPARLGLPEVGLGVLPGAGGTQRLPRLIGAEQALRLMLTGRPIGAPEALAMGLLDRVTDADLGAEALALARGVAGRAPVPTRDCRSGMRDALAYQKAVAAARKTHAGDRLPGPARIIDCVEAALLLPFDQGLEFERAAFEDLDRSPEAAGLRHVYLAERAASRFPESRVPPRPVEAPGIMGADGAALAQLMLQAGLRVTLADTDRAALVAALERIATAQETAVTEGRMRPEARDADWARLTPGLGAAGVADCDLVVVLDGATLADVAQATRPGVVLALAAQGSGLPGGRAADLLGLALAGPGGRLAEVIVGQATAPESVATMVAVLRRLGLVALRTRAPGGVGHVVAAAGQAAVAHLRAQGVPAGDLAAALAAFGLPGLMPGVAADPARAEAARPLLVPVLAAMANAGARLVGQGIAQRPSDVDLAMVAGQGYPRWEGGPMHWADGRGLLILRRDLRALQAEAPALWTPAPLVEDLAAKGASFASLNAR